MLLLCFSVQKIPNEDVIEGITSLDKTTQWDIMFFIETALAKVKSQAIITGTFTSGGHAPFKPKHGKNQT